MQRIRVRIKRIIIPHAQTKRAVRYFSLLSNRASRKHAGLTLIRQEVQHGLQEEGQVADGQTGVAHATGSVNKLVEEAYLNSSPAPVDTWRRGRQRSQSRPINIYSIDDEASRRNHRRKRLFTARRLQHGSQAPDRYPPQHKR